MGILDKLEGAIERATQLVVARTFRAEVQPVEIASAMRRAMDDKATRTSKGRSIVPNVYTIELSETDFERLAGWGDDLDDELIAAAEEHCDTQGYAPGGPLQINLVEDATLETGIFRLRPSTARSVRTSAADDAGQDAPGTPDPDQIAAFEAESTAAAGPNVPDPADIVESRAAPAPPGTPPARRWRSAGSRPRSSTARRRPRPGRRRRWR